MKKIFFLLAISISFVFAKVNTVVSIVPQKAFVEAIGGDKVNVALMVKPGNSPHTYEPKASQMKDISKADLYFSIGVEFEEVWLDKFSNQNKNMKIIDITNGIEKIAMVGHHHHGGEEKHTDDKHDGLDPHIWLSPANIKVISKNIYEALVNVDNVNKQYYKSNYEKFVSKIDATDNEIKTILANTPNETKFMVFHPSWGYFAKEYNLVQFPIEIEGKNPKPKQIAYILDEAKEEGVRAIFTAPEFSDKIARQIANELNIKVIKVSPLNENWSENLIDLAKAIKGE